MEMREKMLCVEHKALPRKGGAVLTGVSLL